MEAPVRDTVVIDGKTIKITKLPPAADNPDLHFDRWAHDDAGHSSEIDRSEALAHKDFGAPLRSDGSRTRAKRQAE